MKNIEKQKEHAKKWRANNKDRVKEYDKKWRERNKDHVKEYEKKANSLCTNGHTCPIVNGDLQCLG